MASLFRPTLDLMAQYAAYHRDRRNIATHFIGIPLIVFAISVLLARAEFDIAATPMNAAIVLWGITALWYLTRGNLVLGAATAVVNGVLTALAMTLVQSATTTGWLVFGIGSFVIGWVFQFVGHYYEGRKPALRRRPRRPAGRPDVRRRARPCSCWAGGAPCWPRSRSAWVRHTSATWLIRSRVKPLVQGVPWPVLQTAPRLEPQPFGTYIALTGRNVSGLSPRGDGDACRIDRHAHRLSGPARERPGARPARFTTPTLERVRQ